MTTCDVSKDKRFCVNSIIELPERKMNIRRPLREEFPDWPQKEPLSLDGIIDSRKRRR